MKKKRILLLSTMVAVSLFTPGCQLLQGLLGAAGADLGGGGGYDGGGSAIGGGGGYDGGGSAIGGADLGGGGYDDANWDDDLSQTATSSAGGAAIQGSAGVEDVPGLTCGPSG